MPYDKGDGKYGGIEERMEELCETIPGEIGAWELEECRENHAHYVAKSDDQLLYAELHVRGAGENEVAFLDGYTAGPEGETDFHIGGISVEPLRAFKDADRAVKNLTNFVKEFGPQEEVGDLLEDVKRIELGG